MMGLCCGDCCRSASSCVTAAVNMANSAVIPQLSDHEISETSGFALENPEVMHPNLNFLIGQL